MSTQNTHGLVVHGLSHRYAVRNVLENINFDLRRGESLALVGASGCGKSTLLMICAGLLRPSEGRLENRFLTPAIMFQQPRLLPWKTALDNIALGLKACGLPRDERHARARELGTRLGLLFEDLDKFPHQLSGGMQARVALARAFALEPDLLLLDEPFAALDIGLKAELYLLLLEQIEMRGTGVLMITHDLMEAARLANRILVMASEPGRIMRHFELSVPPRERDDAEVHQSTARLLQDEVVRTCFALPPLASRTAI